MNIAREPNFVAKTSLESTIKLLLIVELDKIEQERAATVQWIKDGIKASDKKSGRPVGKLDKISDKFFAIKLYQNMKQFENIHLLKTLNLCVFETV